MQKDLVDDSYWNDAREVDSNVNVLSLGLIEYKNAISDPGQLINTVELS